MKNNYQRKIELIAKWLILLEKMRKINQVLYKDTELFEGRLETDFDEEVHSFFAAKITIYNKWRNELFGRLPKDCEKGEKPIKPRLSYEDRREVLHKILIMED